MSIEETAMAMWWAHHESPTPMTKQQIFEEWTTTTGFVRGHWRQEAKTFLRTMEKIK